MRYFFKERVLILYYHNLCIERKPRTCILNPVINPSVFAKQMKHLKKHYNVISIDECVEALQEKRRLDSYSVVIAFDDGYVSQYQYAFPILKKMRINAIFFINASFVGTNNLFWWEELEYMLMHCRKDNITIQMDRQEMVFELKSYTLKKQACQMAATIFKKIDSNHGSKLLSLFREATEIKVSDVKTYVENYRCLNQEMIKEMLNTGMRIGSHTVSHVILANETYETQKEEIENSIKYLDTSKPLHFSYPNGDFGDFNSDTVQILKSCNFQTGLTAIPGFVNKGDDLYRLKRWVAESDFLEFVCDISGLHYFLAKIEGVIIRLRRLIKRLIYG